MVVLSKPRSSSRDPEEGAAAEESKKRRGSSAAGRRRAEEDFGTATRTWLRTARLSKFPRDRNSCIALCIMRDLPAPVQEGVGGTIRQNQPDTNQECHHKKKWGFKKSSRILQSCLVPSPYQMASFQCWHVCTCETKVHQRTSLSSIQYIFIQLPCFYTFTDRQTCCSVYLRGSTKTTMGWWWSSWVRAIEETYTDRPSPVEDPASFRDNCDDRRWLRRPPHPIDHHSHTNQTVKPKAHARAPHTHIEGQREGEREITVDCRKESPL